MHQFGARPGQTTIDTLHILTGFVIDTWHKGDDVAVDLFLDIKSAFPSINHNILVHNMWVRGVIVELTRWIHKKLSNCTARLAFDDHTTELLQLPMGIDQGCILSPISYMYHNADLVCSNPNRNTLKLSFNDNTIFLARAKTFEAANDVLTEMMTKDSGALDWAKSHHLTFEIEKTLLICFTGHRDKCSRYTNGNGAVQGTSIHIDGCTIKRQQTTKYLGVILDSEL